MTSPGITSHKVTQPEKEALFSVLSEVLEAIAKTLEQLPLNEESLPKIEVRTTAALCSLSLMISVNFQSYQSYK